MGVLIALVLCVSAAHADTHSNADVDDPGYYGESPAINEPPVDAIVNRPSITARILGGQNAEGAEWPAMVAFTRVGTRRLEDRFFCAGTVVADRWVMTAAHCMFDSVGDPVEASSIRAVAGISDLATTELVNEQVVTSIVVHPDYVNPAPDDTNSILSNDIALIELANVTGVTPISLFVKESDDYAGTMGFIAGWGGRNYDDVSQQAFDFPTLLQEASVPLVSMATCNSATSYAGALKNTQVCAGFQQGGVDSCTGDSGGPLVIIENGETLQLGITSFGSGCGLPDLYGIYTDISHFIPWLSDYITVPEQDPDLIAQREAAAQNMASGTTQRRFFLGSSHPFLLFGLAVWFFARRMQHKRRCRVICSFTVLLICSGCSSYPLANTQPVQSSDTTMSQPASSDWTGLEIDESKNIATRAGFGALRLGGQQNALTPMVEHLGFLVEECNGGKRSLRGSGRVFFYEKCLASHSESLLYFGQPVTALQLHYLDEKVVRIDVTFDQLDAVEINQVLTDQYGLPSDISGLMSRVWVHDNDRIWVGQLDVALIKNKVISDDKNNTVTLSFADGRLITTMPALFQ